MTTLNWTIRDVEPSGPFYDKHQTEWRATFRDLELVILRTKGRYVLWVERRGVKSWQQTANNLFDAKEEVRSAAILALDGCGLEEAEYNVLSLPYLEALEVILRQQAQRLAEQKLYGQELRLHLEADRVHEGIMETRREQNIPIDQEPVDNTKPVTTFSG